MMHPSWDIGRAGLPHTKRTCQMNQQAELLQGVINRFHM